MIAPQPYDAKIPPLWTLTIEGPIQEDGTYVQRKVYVSDPLVQQSYFRIETGDKARDDMHAVYKLAGFEL